MRRLIALALLCVPPALLAQAESTVSPGMTRAQVIAALGAPATQRSANGFTYMFYPNTCGRACGMQDLVIMKGDSLADAIFRSANRHYTGTSSSPDEVAPEANAARPAPTPLLMRKDDAPSAPAQMKPPAKANDAKPSIPTDQKPLAPAPAKGADSTSPPAPTKQTSG
jgi:hypothetical protein